MQWLTSFPAPDGSSLFSPTPDVHPVGVTQTCPLPTDTLRTLALKRSLLLEKR